MASDVFNFLSGRSFDPTTTTTTTPTTATGATDTSAPTEAAPRQSRTIILLHIPPQLMHHPQRSLLAPPKRMHDKEYQRKNFEKPKE
ncbi:hypothetical protein Syun_030032 [Stephania yunnanensis]|uniref:Uncharacterized protein n=1 Tax=Stephania yunnanensis TaxID=152371 RepID=A0AAP0EE97_9MAGN